tara:strand:- start:845 stop:1021 length:177 start_codon:yes stop_codon:yes gene_type:complete
MSLSNVTGVVELSPEQLAVVIRTLGEVKIAEIKSEADVVPFYTALRELKNTFREIMEQ